jgi:iron complex outermembrane receptor protein
VAGSGNEKGNVTIVDTANVGDTQVSIRGIVSTRDAEWTFACVVDGVLITNPNAFNGELIDIAQIEVLNGRMELALALRYDEEDRSVSNQVPNVLSSGLNINLAGQPINPADTQFPGGIPDCSEKFSEWRPKVTWRWAVTDNVNLYASWGRGFRRGGFNSIGSEAIIDFWYNAGFGGPGELVGSGLTIQDEYEKEVTDSFEVGVKTLLLDNRLCLNAAAFQNDIDDNQFFEFFAGPFGLMRVVTTIDKAEVSGFEADFN